MQPMSGWFEIPCVTRCRELIAQGDVEGLAEAQEDLQAYVEMNEADHNTYQLIALKTLQAAAYERQGRAELNGILETLYSLHLPILSVKKIDNVG